MLNLKKKSSDRYFKIKIERKIFRYKYRETFAEGEKSFTGKLKKNFSETQKKKLREIYKKKIEEKAEKNFYERTSKKNFREKSLERNPKNLEWGKIFRENFLERNKDKNFQRERKSSKKN